MLDVHLGELQRVLQLEQGGVRGGTVGRHTPDSREQGWHEEWLERVARKASVIVRMGARMRGRQSCVASCRRVASCRCVAEGGAVHRLRVGRCTG